MTTALPNTENKTGRDPETESTEMCAKVLSNMFLRGRSIPQLWQAVFFKCFLFLLFPSIWILPFLLQFKLITSCHLHHNLERTPQVKQLKVSHCFLFNTAEHSDCPLDPLQFVVYMPLILQFLNEVTRDQCRNTGMFSSLYSICFAVLCRHLDLFLKDC